MKKPTLATFVALTLAVCFSAQAETRNEMLRKQYDFPESGSAVEHSIARDANGKLTDAGLTELDSISKSTAYSSKVLSAKVTNNAKIEILFNEQMDLSEGTGKLVNIPGTEKKTVVLGDGSVLFAIFAEDFTSVGDIVYNNTEPHYVMVDGVLAAERRKTMIDGLTISKHNDLSNGLVQVLKVSYDTDGTVDLTHNPADFDADLNKVTIPLTQTNSAQNVLVRKKSKAQFEFSTMVAKATKAELQPEFDALKANQATMMGSDTTTHEKLDVVTGYVELIPGMNETINGLATQESMSEALSILNEVTDAGFDENTTEDIMIDPEG